MSVFVISYKGGDKETSMSRESSEDLCTNSQIRLSEQRFTLMSNTNGNSSDRTIYRRSLRVPKRGFEPKTKRRKPLETLGFGNFGGFG